MTEPAVVIGPIGAPGSGWPRGREQGRQVIDRNVVFPGFEVGFMNFLKKPRVDVGGHDRCRVAGRFGERDVTILDSYEAVGAVLAGAMDEATLARLERSCLPTVGACAGQFTANTMAMVSEALGLSVPNGR